MEGCEVAKQPYWSTGVGQSALLQHDTHGGAVVGPGLPRIGAQDADLSRVRALQPLGALDGRRLAGAVGTQDCCHFAMASGPRHTRKGSGCTKSLGEIAHTHGLGHAQESRSLGDDYLYEISVLTAA